jgi:uncharacterized protein (DUF1697 family)
MYALFLRNIMIGRKGYDRVALLDVLGRCGALQAQSYLATGNFSFSIDGSLGEFQAQVEVLLRREFGYIAPTYIYAISALRALAAKRPFDRTELGNPYERCVTFLPPGTILPKSVIQLERMDRRSFVFLARGPFVFSTTYKVGKGSISAGSAIEKAIGQPVTTRNWNKVMRLVEAKPA